MLDIGGKEPNGVVEVTFVGFRDPLLGSVCLIEPLHVAQSSGVWLQPRGPTSLIIQNLLSPTVPSRFLLLHGKAGERRRRAKAQENPSVPVLSWDPRPPAQAPPTHRVIRPGHFSPERGSKASSPETAGKWYFPEVTPRPPRAASDLPEVVDGGRCIPRLCEGEVTPAPPPPWAVRLGT